MLTKIKQVLQEHERTEGEEEEEEERKIASEEEEHQLLFGRKFASSSERLRVECGTPLAG